ncbi:hypothetical protein M2440_001245 [Methylorubrum extorquens]|nr:hypothetical protein [Methylorubrum extorquens]
MRGQKLGKGVGFREIVVAPGSQTLHPVVHLAQRREDEDRRGDLLLAQGAHERKPVELRQHAIDDQHVVIALTGERIAVEAVARMVHRVPGFPERFDQIGGGLAVVLDDEQAHDACQIRFAAQEREAFTDNSGLWLRVWNTTQ